MEERQFPERGDCTECSVQPCSSGSACTAPSTGHRAEHVWWLQAMAVITMAKMMAARRMWWRRTHAGVSSLIGTTGLPQDLSALG
jgi:hypothetical protein